MIKSISILNIVENTVVDGPGFRTAIYAAGCSNRCEGCHNPQSWDPANGSPMTIEELMQILSADPFSNVTFSGGDPMFQPEGFTELARRIKAETKKNIWCYTGYTYEEIEQNPAQSGLLAFIDVLVDGPYVHSLSDDSLCFRGSRNQRLIDIPASRQKREVVLYDYSPLPEL